jgi:ABC-type Fe3+/spermidine/putrescine transport system ATPase subunit
MSLDLDYRNVTKIFGEGGKTPVKALKDVSFTIKPGELFCLLGPSGCGKTTLLRSTAGLESISSGHIYYGGKDMTTIPPFRRNIGMVFQSFALYPHMNIYENVAYGLRVRKRPEEEVRKKVTAVMELVGMAEELKRNPSPSGLSGGQQQRVAIARALVYDPDILLLDEPLANLDAKLRRYMRAEIRRIQKATNITTIFVTHDQEEAMAVGDRLAVMRRGIVEQIGSSDELYNSPGNAFVANFIGKMNFLKAELLGIDEGKARARIEGIGFEVETAGTRVRLPQETKAGTKVLVGCRPEQMSISPSGASSGASSGAETTGQMEGRVNIIQHLGQFVRYDVSVDAGISAQAFEIDMPGLVRGLSEGDKVRVSLKPGLASLYLPDEGRPE